MSNIKTNYYKEYKETSDLINQTEIVNLVSTMADSYLQENGDEYEKKNNNLDDIHLNVIVEMYANLMQIISPETFAECEEFLAESKDNDTERFIKMKFIISELIGFQGRAIKNAAANINRWLKLTPSKDHSNFQAILYNFGIEIEKNQETIIKKYNQI
jgi:hypothetical protein